MSAPTRTDLVFHRDATLHTLRTTISTITPFSSLPSASQALFKSALPDPDPATNPSPLFAITCPATIFHPQGGGQPSDTGTITSTSAQAAPTTTFTVLTARTDADGQVLHLGHYDPAPGPGSNPLAPGAPITQSIDPGSRLLFSRLHTAGHVLGSAVRHLCEAAVPSFDELKASHFPGASSCEFAGVIEGRWKVPIQERVDELVAADLPVRIEWWDEDEFRSRGLERLIPDREAMGLAEGEKFRVVNIVGAEVYPCGGTHVEGTAGCGRTVVRKIARSKGVSRVAYTVEGA